MTGSRLNVLAVATLLALVFSACDRVAPPPNVDLAPQIIFGERDNDEHPYVGSLLFVQDGEGYFSCTGTLLSSTVMLTAGHCLEGSSGEPNDATYCAFYRGGA